MPARKTPVSRFKAAAITAMLGASLGIAALSLTAGADTTPPASAGLSEVNISDGFSSLVKAVKPAVVNISTTSREQGGNIPHFGNRNMP